MLLTWVWHPVAVLWHIVVQCQQHDPNGEDEHPSQERIEHQVEQENEACREKASDQSREIDRERD